MRGTDADALSASYAEGVRDERARRDYMISDQQDLCYEFYKWKRDQEAAWQEQIGNAERRAEKAEADREALVEALMEALEKAAESMHKAHWKEGRRE